MYMKHTFMYSVDSWAKIIFKLFQVMTFNFFYEDYYVQREELFYFWHNL